MKTMSIKQTKHMSSIGFENHIKFFTDGRGSLDGLGQSGAWGEPDDSLQMLNDGETRHIQNTDHLLPMAGGWLNPYSF